jgi:hypothetical protein
VLASAAETASIGIMMGDSSSSGGGDGSAAAAVNLVTEDDLSYMYNELQKRGLLRGYGSVTMDVVPYRCDIICFASQRMLMCTH